MSVPTSSYEIVCEGASFQWNVLLDNGQLVWIILIGDTQKIGQRSLLKIQNIIEGMLRLEHDIICIEKNDLITTELLDSDLGTLVKIKGLFQSFGKEFEQIKKKNIDLYEKYCQELRRQKEQHDFVLIFQNFKGAG